MTLRRLSQWFRRVMFAYHRDEAATHLGWADLHQNLAARWAARHHQGTRPPELLASARQRPPVPTGRHRPGEIDGETQ